MAIAMSKVLYIAYIYFMQKQAFNTTKVMTIITQPANHCSISMYSMYLELMMQINDHKHVYTKKIITNTAYTCLSVQMTYIKFTMM